MQDHALRLNLSLIAVLGKCSCLLTGQDASWRAFGIVQNWTLGPKQVNNTNVEIPNNTNVESLRHKGTFPSKMGEDLHLDGLRWLSFHHPKAQPVQYWEAPWDFTYKWVLASTFYKLGLRASMYCQCHVSKSIHRPALSQGSLSLRTLSLSYDHEKLKTGSLPFGDTSQFLFNWSSFCFQEGFTWGGFLLAKRREQSVTTEQLGNHSRSAPEQYPRQVLHF